MVNLVWISNALDELGIIENIINMFQWNIKFKKYVFEST